MEVPIEIAVSPDGRFLGLIDKAAHFHIFDLHTDREVFKQRLARDASFSKDDIHSIVFSSDNNHAAVIFDDGLYVIDLETIMEEIGQ